MTPDPQAVVQALCPHDRTEVLAWKQPDQFGPFEALQRCLLCDLIGYDLTGCDAGPVELIAAWLPAPPRPPLPPAVSDANQRLLQRLLPLGRRT